MKQYFILEWFAHHGLIVDDVMTAWVMFRRLPADVRPERVKVGTRWVVVE